MFLLILWVASYVLATALDRTVRQDRSNKLFWSLSRHDLSFDYVVAGASRAYNNIDVVILEARTGRTAINLALGGQSIMDMYLTLHLFLLNRNDFHHLLLQLDGSDLDYSHKFLTHLFVPYMADREVAATLRDLSGAEHYYFTKVFPLAKYAEYNDFYTLRFLMQSRAKKSPYDKSAGSELLFDDSYHSFPAVEGEPEFKVDARSLHYLDRIVGLTRSRGIGLTVFSAPTYHHERVFEMYDQSSRSYISEYCREHEIPYFDFTDAPFDESEFRDYGHLNGRGAVRFTTMLAESLLEAEMAAHQGQGTNDKR
jgi:hypothetical protein